MSLRVRIALLCCLASLGAAGLVGVLLISEARSHAADELAEKQLLFAQNRAFQLGYSVELATRELVRLSQMAEVDLSDNDLQPEAQLLAHAHRNSTLFNIGLQIEDAQGRCLWSEPASDACKGRAFGEAAWFREVRRTRAPAVMGERAEGMPTIVDLVVPIGAAAKGPIAGVLRGIIDLRSDRVVAPSLSARLPAGTEAALVARDGTVLYPGRLGLAWARAAQLAPRGPAGAFVGDDRGEPYLYAYAPVAQTNWGLVYRWPMALLDRGERRLTRLLVLLSLAGGVAAIVLGLVTSRFLAEPIAAVVQGVRRLGLSRGQLDALPPAAVERVAARPDELGELARAFRELRDRLKEGDEQHRQDLERIRELAATLEGRVQARTAELEAAQRSLLAQERLAAMGQAAAVISHELKNSLGAIGMGVDLVAGAARTEGLQRAHAQVRAEVTRLRTLTDELLVFARSPRIDRRRAGLRGLAERAISLCAEQAKDAGVKVTLADGPDVLASFDGERLQSVIVNLLQNAIEAVAWQREPRRPEREVLLQVLPPTPDAARFATIAIEDSGPGLEAAARAHLFEPFFTTKRNGTGLGLATAQRFVGAHGGMLQLADASSLGGARFEVSLPVDGAPAEAA